MGSKNMVERHRKEKLAQQGEGEKRNTKKPLSGFRRLEKPNKSFVGFIYLYLLGGGAGDGR